MVYSLERIKRYSRRNCIFQPSTLVPDGFSTILLIAGLMRVHVPPTHVMGQEPKLDRAENPPSTLSLVEEIVSRVQVS